MLMPMCCIGKIMPVYISIIGTS